MEAFLALLPGALMIFGLRILDVSLGTIRVIYMIRGRRFLAAGLGLIESLVFIFAVSRIVAGNPETVKMIAYACGFATGTLAGMTIERWIDSSSIIVRLIPKHRQSELLTSLREAGFGVTSVRGEGRTGDVTILFIVAPRKRGPRLLELIREHDPAAFITIDPVHKAIGGFIPSVAAAPPTLRK
jgi:uncharacterized protein YebE (UPF0316 family)